MAERIRVMIVDESAVMRRVVSQTLSEASEIEVVATAGDLFFARQKLAAARPDVVFLDVEMADGEGVSFGRELLAGQSISVIVCSALPEIRVLNMLGVQKTAAVSVITKPNLGLKQFLESAADEILRAVRAAGRIGGRMVGSNRQSLTAKLPTDVPLPVGTAPILGGKGESVIAIGTSTGGTLALEFVLTGLPADCPGIVIVQHMPEVFTAMFAERLDGLCALEVREARHGDLVRPGRALIAPGGRHLLLNGKGARYTVELSDGPPVNRHKPSVDVLFGSVAKIAGTNALGIIMTGMGNDGARGLKEMHDAGAQTLAQDEASCVVYGMPMEAVKRGAADQVISLDQIPAAIMAFARSE